MFMSNASQILAEMTRLDALGESFVSVTLASTRGSTPQEVGAKMVVTPRGRVCGTIGGGRLEEAALKQAGALLMRESEIGCLLLEWNLQHDIGMTCGGVVSVLFEVFHQSTWQIVIFGAGHVAQALARVLVSLKCRITVFDTRPEWLCGLPTAPNLLAQKSDPLENAVASIPEGAFVALMTQGHRTDKPVLERILKTRNFPYLGVIGSASKAATLRRELRENGISPARAKAFRCPLGLRLGKNSPEEIAISIAAEMLSVRGIDAVRRISSG